MCHKEYIGEKGVSGACSQYGKSYGKLKFCAECGLANYCKD